jgi:hypothetical protein
MRLNNLMLPLLLLAACSGADTDSVTDEVTVVQKPIVDAPTPVVDKPVVEPPVVVEKPIDPDTETGSVEKPRTLAQAGIPPPHFSRRGYAPPEQVQVKLLGQYSEKWVAINLSKPPLDLTPCNHGIILSKEATEIVSDINQYNSWWLVASKSAVAKNWRQNKNVYLYWAKQISDTEVGVVPVADEYNAEELTDVKINTGFAELTYQWISPLQMYTHIPTNPEEPCAQ